MRNNLYLIPGHSNSGKTSWVEKAVDFLLSKNLTVDKNPDFDILL